MHENTVEKNAGEKETKLEYLKRIYTDPKHPGSFSGPDKLLKVTRNDGLFKVTRKDIRKFLESQDTYTVNRFVRRRFRRNKIIAHGVNDQFDIDLCDLSRLARYNSNVKFLLVAIDVFSRFAVVRPLKNKTAVSVEKALESIFTGDHDQVMRVRSDLGSEFKNSVVKQFFENKGIKQYFSTNVLKCQIVERFNQTLKQLIFRYLFEKNSYRYLDALGDIVEAYNKRPHRSLLGLSPAEVTEENQARLWNRMYVTSGIGKGKGSNKRKVQQFKFNINDFVRVSQAKKTFERAYNQKFSLEPFQISARFYRHGIPVYMLKDMQGEGLSEPFFYESELQGIKVKSNDELWKVEKILKTRGKGKQQEVLVKWYGFPDKFNQWQLKSSLKSIA